MMGITNMNKNIFFIHGAWASGVCFNYLEEKARGAGCSGEIKRFLYDCQNETSSKFIERAKVELAELSSNGLETIVVGHSLGGIVALHMAQEAGVSSVITMASPLAGLMQFNVIINSVLSHHTPILVCLQPNSVMMRDIHNAEYNVPVDVIVSQKGHNPLVTKTPTDGVISVASQTDWLPSTAAVYGVDVNHHDILQSPEPVRVLTRALHR
jgi:hypothetical protein